MKKKSCLMLAVLLAMLQVIAVFAIVPASAAFELAQRYNRSYNVYKSENAITIDGNIDEWSNIPWSDSFVCASDSMAGTQDELVNTAFNRKLDVKFKSVWHQADANTVNLYLMIYVEGDTTLSKTTNANGDMFRIDIKHFNDGTEYNRYFWTGGLLLDASGADVDKSTGHEVNLNSSKEKCYYYIKDNRDTAEGGYIIEFCRPMSTAKTNAQSTPLDANPATTEWDIAFDMYVQDNIDSAAATGTARARYSWNGASNQGWSAPPVGILTLKDAAVPANPLAGVGVTATAGASIRLDTATPTKSGIRFATTVAVPEGVTVKKTGTLIIPTDTLTYHRITDSNFNKDVLTTKGLEEGTDYYDIENVGNEWVADTTGTWYGTLFGIQKENFERKISGIGYAVVEVNGVEYTVYAEYDSDIHSRSIKQVAELVINQYEEGTDEHDLLLGFTQAEATQP